MTKDERLLAFALLLLCLSAAFVGSDVIKQTSPECIEVACDRAPADYDQRAILDQILGSKSCQQCQEHGYSPLKNASLDQETKNTANETADGYDRPFPYAVCQHFAPSDCEEYVHSSSETAHLKSAKVIQTLCYLDVLENLTAPVVRDDNGTIFIDVEPFWKKAYWKSFQITNFTLHSKYIIEDPPLCVGNASGSNGTYKCEWQKLIEVPSDEDAKLDAVQISRQTIASEEMITFWYTVVLTRPRQLKKKRGMEAFVTATTNISSPTYDANLAVKD